MINEFNMHTQPAIWNNSKKNVWDIPPSTAAAACEDCVETLYPTAEITSQCTDQCVVIACSDPDHDDVNPCYGTGIQRCDLVCDGAAKCTDCDGFDEFLQCCTNFHSYQPEPRNDVQLANTAFNWESSFQEFLCSCEDPGVQPFPGQYPQYPDTSPTSPMGSASASYTPGDASIQATPLLSPASTPYLMPAPSPASEPELLTCMWGNCHSSFTSLPELVGHVNLQHLRLPSTASQQRTHDAQALPDIAQLACQWRDCDVYQSSHTIPNSSSGDHVHEVLNFLANHLLEDHLGMNNCPREGTNIVEVKPDTSQPSPSLSPSPGAHKCLWQACGCLFGSFEELTSHITVAHIGGGKAKYDCFWEGCSRNGDNGFSSKQKICRHLQSHTGHRPHQCKICSQYFSEPATLQQHMRRHTQEKPYVCDYPGCGKTFAITGALTIHKRVHNGQKPFKCKFCDKAFAESSNLSKHLRTHTGARPYSCTEPGCNKSFARPDQLTRHLGVHRKKSPDQTTQQQRPLVALR